ncbi:hypothetical protein DFJ58DRAFT_892498 [Suillus subalutaceus]|uniref:uncharacterized protein n=1 Tax=Suillus subalutaceus TaxID=48586 RepID=UPI001B8816E4|nr:uncharacterized protein DFJ58DRAFT_892498 [Suillus subalutaceus]KAG1871235.1 hypothetical protein DFJ58DRAFT_892498 [Suillus subalutaceus]
MLVHDTVVTLQREQELGEAPVCGVHIHCIIGLWFGKHFWIATSITEFITLLSLRGVQYSIMRFDFICTALNSSQISVATKGFGDVEQDNKGLVHRPAMNPLKSDFSNLSGETCATLGIHISKFALPVQVQATQQYLTRADLEQVITPAVYGHLQTLTNHADQCSPVMMMWLGPDGILYRHAGGSGRRHIILLAMSQETPSDNHNSYRTDGVRTYGIQLRRLYLSHRRARS